MHQLGWCAVLNNEVGPCKRGAQAGSGHIKESEEMGTRRELGASKDNPNVWLSLVANRSWYFLGTIVWFIIKESETMRSVFIEHLFLSICYYHSSYFRVVVLHFPASLYQSYKNFHSYIIEANVLILLESKWILLD